MKGDGDGRRRLPAYVEQLLAPRRRPRSLLPAGLEKMFDRYRAVTWAVSGRLATSFDAFIAIHDPDPAERDAAIERMIERQPAFEAFQREKGRQRDRETRQSARLEERQRRNRGLSPGPTSRRQQADTARIDLTVTAMVENAIKNGATADDLTDWKRAEEFVDPDKSIKRSIPPRTLSRRLKLVREEFARRQVFNSQEK